jgi:hypothetical protein
MTKAMEDSEAECSTAAFPKLFMFREAGMQVSLVTMSHPSPRTVAPPSCLPLDIKDWLEEDRSCFDRDFLFACCSLLVRLPLRLLC